MKNFNVYHHPVHGYEAVKVGFSWPAFFFCGIWLLVKRLWWWALCFLGVSIIITLLEESENPDFMLIIIIGNLGIWLTPAFLGNQWREANLKNKGYTFMESISANNVDDAMAKIVK